MNLASVVRLFTLAAIWGASFLFTRISVPELGPVILIEFRVGLAALFLAAIALGMMTGSCIVIVGTALVTGFNPATLLLRRAPGNA